MAKDPQKSTALNIGDSIGLFSLLFAVCSFSLSPAVWIRALLILLAAIGLPIAINTSHWTHPRTRFQRLALSVVGVGLLIFVGTHQINQQLASNHMPTIQEMIGATLILCILYISRSTLLNGLFWISFGAIFTLLFQRMKAFVVGRRASLKRMVVMERGFLDYKLQLEQAMIDLAPSLQPISNITVQVSEMVQKQTLKIQAAASMPTASQLRVTNITGRKLDQFSKRMNTKCLKYKAVANSFQEGLFGLLGGKSQQVNGYPLLIALAPSLQSLAATIEVTLNSLAGYIEIMLASKGLSQGMNRAFDHHIQSVSSVRDVSAQVLACCKEALKSVDLKDEGG
jgi:hypothetical protein